MGPRQRAAALLADGLVEGPQRPAHQRKVTTVIAISSRGTSNAGATASAVGGLRVQLLRGHFRVDLCDCSLLLHLCSERRGSSPNLWVRSPRLAPHATWT